jgi:chromosome segregation ATPase
MYDIFALGCRLGETNNDCFSYDFIQVASSDKVELIGKLQLSEAKTNSLQSELNELSTKCQGWSILAHNRAFSLHRYILLFLDALSKLTEAESSKSAMHDMEKSLSAQAHELAKYQNRCNELEMELAGLQASTRQSEMTSKVRSIDLTCY